MVERDVNVRDDWWHIILFTPISVILGGQLGSIGVIVMVSMALSYPIALYKDTKYVKSTSSKWVPNTRIYTIIGIFVLFSFGILSYIVSPIYLYLRHKYV